MLLPSSNIPDIRRLLSEMEAECFSRPWSPEQIESTLKAGTVLVCLQDTARRHGSLLASSRPPNNTNETQEMDIATYAREGGKVAAEEQAAPEMKPGQMAAYAIVSQAAPREPAELYRIGVLPDFRRQGRSGRLLAYCLECVQKHFPSASRLLLEVDEKNRAAVALYRRQGFHEIHRRKAYYASSDALILEYALCGRT